MNKVFIKNRDKIDISVAIEGEKNKAGLAFVAHGLGGFKEQVHIRAMAEAFLEADYVVVTYDAANTIGESGGRVEDATLTNHLEDLEDVTEWASAQEWYKEPIVIAGHSLGGAASIMYAAKYPERVKAIIPVCSHLSGKLLASTKSQQELDEWKRKGYQEQPSYSKPGIIKKISWRFMEDALEQDAHELIPDLRCKVLLISGAEDKATPTEHQAQFAKELQIPYEHHIITGMGHNPRTQEHNAELKRVIVTWLEDL